MANTGGLRGAMKLPPELLGEVFRYLSKVDIKSVRLCSKRFTPPATSLLFDTIKLVPKVRTLDRAKLICQHFASSVKTIAICPVGFLRYSQDLLAREDYTKRARTQFIKYALEHPSERTIESHFQKFRRLCKEADDILDGGEIYFCLAHALSAATNAHEVVFCPAKRGTRPLFRCQGTLPRQSQVFWEVDSSFLLEFDGAREVNRLLVAIRNTTHSIHELRFHQDMGLPCEAFSLSTRQRHHLSDFLSSLTKLQLTFTDNSSGIGLFYTNVHIHEVLARAENLKALAIHMGEEDIHLEPSILETWFGVILKDCSYPKLKTLILSSFDTGAQELSAFLRRSKNLKHLVIEKCFLAAGEWAGLLSEIRDSLALDSIWVNQLTGGLEMQDHLPYGWWDHFGHVPRYFFEDGTNPFSDAELDKWRTLVGDIVLDEQALRTRAESHKIAFGDYMSTIF